MKIISSFIFVFVTWALSGCVTGNTNPTSADTRNMKRIVEQVKLNLPKNFHEGFRHKNADGSYILEYVPEGQTVENWQEIITVQYFPINAEPEEFYLGLGKLMSKQCKDFGMERPLSREAGGLHFARGSTFCGTNPQSGKGEITVYNFIKGLTGMHGVQRAIRVAPFTPQKLPLDKKMVAAWGEFFNKSTLCQQTEGESVKCIKL